MTDPRPPHLAMHETLTALHAQTQDLATHWATQMETFRHDLTALQVAQTETVHTALTTLTDTLRTELRGHGVLMAELHGELTTAGQAVQQQTQQLDRQYHALVAWQQRRSGRLLWSAGSGFAVGLVAMGLTWGLWPSAGPAAERLLKGVDQILVQQWRTVPKAMQEHLTTTYSREGVVSPEHRQSKGGKP